VKVGLWVTNPDSANEGSLDAANYIDLSGSWEFVDGITARAGVNNVFEHNFPISVSSGPAINGNNNTFPGIYDTGRFLRFELEALVLRIPRFESGPSGPLFFMG